MPNLQCHSTENALIIFLSLLSDLAGLEQAVPVCTLLLQLNLQRRQRLLYSVRLFLLCRQSLANVVHLGFKVVRLRLERQPPHLHLLLALHLLVNYLRIIHSYLC